MKHFSIVVVTMTTVMASVGCQQSARIAWDRPQAVARHQTPIYVQDLTRAEEGAVWGSKARGESIGKHTFTVFAIPTGNINADEATPVCPTYAKALNEALQAAGYDVRPASEAPSNAPVLTPKLQKCWFWSYSWFWPVFLQGGDVKMHLQLQSPDGQSLWDKEFKAYAPGLGIIGSFGFDGMVRSASTRVVKSITEECSDEEFRRLVTTKTAAVSASKQDS